MFTKEDRYLNELEDRANKLLRGSDDQEDSHLDESELLPHALLGNVTRDLHVAKSDSQLTDSRYSRNQNNDLVFPQALMQNQKITLLTSQLQEARIENQVLKRMNAQTANSKNSQPRLESQLSKFKNEIRLQLQKRFKSEIEIWIQKTKTIEKQKAVQMDLYQKELHQKERQITQSGRQKRILKKQIRNLHRFITREMPGITSELKANSLLVESCISKFYPTS